MTTLLALASALVAATLLVALVYLATVIAHTLEAIGANEPSTAGRSGEPPSYLARIWFGVNAIEKQLSALPGQAVRLNENLAELAAGMETLRSTLGAALAAVKRQAGEQEA